MNDADRMFEDAYISVSKVLDQAHGTDWDSGSEGGIAADVHLLMQQRDEANAALAARDAEIQRLTVDVERMTATARYGRMVHEKLTFWLDAHAPTFPESESGQVVDTMLAYATGSADALKQRDAEIRQLRDEVERLERVIETWPHKDSGYLR